MPPSHVNAHNDAVTVPHYVMRHGTRAARRTRDFRTRVSTQRARGRDFIEAEQNTNLALRLGPAKLQGCEALSQAQALARLTAAGPHPSHALRRLQHDP